MRGRFLIMAGTALLVGAWVAQLTIGWWVPAALVVLGIAATVAGLVMSRPRTHRR
jgi:hypothetical protein